MKKHILVFLKGMAMGMADVVPGVSGGTIAFISGIYQEFINSLKSINAQAFKILFTKGFKTFWKCVNGRFLLPLFVGIFLSILTFSKFITYLLEEYPILLWAFFFGLILASIIFVCKQIDKYNVKVFMALMLGIVVSYYITIVSPSTGYDGYIFIFLYGFIAIIAMILPGVSGSFILLLLGAYHNIISTINNFRVGISVMDIDKILFSSMRLGVFLLGALAGMFCFSRLLSWMFKNHKNITLAMLTGFMIGSLNKVWPWKKVIQWRENAHGKQVPFIEQSVLPYSVENNYLFQSIILMIIGFSIIFLLEKLSNKKINNAL